MDINLKIIYDNNFIEVFNYNDDLFQLDEYIFYDNKNNIIRFNKQYNNYSILIILMEI